MSTSLPQPNNEIVRAIVCEIPLGDCVLDAYLLPNGDKCLGIKGVSLALGYTETWFSKRTNRDSKWLKDLQSTGFQAGQNEVSVIRPDGRGRPIAKTISVRDFVKLVTHEAVTCKNMHAIVLLAAFAEVGLESILENAFAGRSIDFLLEKVVHYSRWTQDDWQEALSYNREDLKELYPWGNNRDLLGRQL